jgi:hypothetical protein
MSVAVLVSIYAVLSYVNEQKKDLFFVRFAKKRQIKDEIIELNLLTSQVTNSKRTPLNP